MWAEGCAVALPRGCVRGGCRCWEPPHALGGLLCGRRGAPEGCAIALPRGCAGGGRRRVPLLGAAACPGRPPVDGGVRRRVCHSPAEGVCRRGAAFGSRRMPWEASYVAGGVRWRGVPGVYRMSSVSLQRGVAVGGRRMLLSRCRCGLVVYMGAFAVGLVASREKSRRVGWELLRVVWWLPEVVFSRYRQTPTSILLHSKIYVIFFFQRK